MAAAGSARGCFGAVRTRTGARPRLDGDILWWPDRVDARVILGGMWLELTAAAPHPSAEAPSSN